MAEFILTASDTLDEGVEGGAREYTLIPEGSILDAEILDVEVRDSYYFWVDPDDHSKGKEKEVSFKFKVTEPGPNKDDWIWGSTSTVFNTHPNCKLRLWVEEIFAVEDSLPADFTLDTSDLKGQPVRIVVENYYSKKNERMQHKVADLQRAGVSHTAVDAF